MFGSGSRRDIDKEVEVNLNALVRFAYFSTNAPLGWNITKSTALYSDYSVCVRNNIHIQAVSIRVSYSFGGNKVNNVYRDSKERESDLSN